MHGTWEHNSNNLLRYMEQDGIHRLAPTHKEIVA